MFGAGMGLEITVVVALHTKYGLHTKHSIHIGVFTAGFLSTTPSWVTENVHIGTPESKFGIAWVVSHTHRHIEYIVVRTIPVGTGFIRDSGEYVVEKLCIK